MEKAEFISRIMQEAGDHPLSEKNFYAVMHSLKIICACLTGEPSRSFLRNSVRGGRQYLDMEDIVSLRHALQHKIPLESSHPEYLEMKTAIETICKEDIPELQSVFMTLAGKLRRRDFDVRREHVQPFSKLHSFSTCWGSSSRPDNTTGGNCIRIFANELEKLKTFLGVEDMESIVTIPSRFSQDSVEVQAALNCLDVLRATRRPPEIVETQQLRRKEQRLFDTVWDEFNKQANFAHEEVQLQQALFGLTVGSGKGGPGDAAHRGLEVSVQALSEYARLTILLGRPGLKEHLKSAQGIVPAVDVSQVASGVGAEQVSQEGAGGEGKTKEQDQRKRVRLNESVEDGSPRYGLGSTE